MTLGPYHFEECEKELKSNGSVTMGESETFFQEVKFSHCEAHRNAGWRPRRSGPRELHARDGIPLQRGAETRSARRTFKATNSLCEVTIPAQWVPGGAETEKGQEKLFEGIEYSTEKEKLEGGPAKKFGEFRERLDIFWEVKGIVTTVKLTPECKYSGSHLNGAGEAEFSGGKMEGELEEVTLNQGNLSFVPPA